MSSYTFKTHKEFGELGECELELTFSYSPWESSTQTYPGSDEDIEVESGRFRYCGQWIGLGDKDCKKFEQDCWDHLSGIDDDHR